MSWKQKVNQFSKSLRGVSIFYSIWVLLKFISILREYQKNSESVKKRKKFFYLGFSPCKAEQPLQGIQLLEKD